MSMAAFESAILLIEKNPQSARFVGPRPPTIVSEAETAVGMRFPPTYRRFLLELGAGEVNSVELYGIPGADLVNRPLPSGIRQTVILRKKYGFPDDLLVVGDVGNGELYCLETKPNEGEGPVVVVQPGLEPLVREPIANDFGEFFLSQVQQALAVAKMSPTERQQAAQIKHRGTLPG